MPDDNVIGDLQGFVADRDREIEKYRNALYELGVDPDALADLPGPSRSDNIIAFADALTEYYEEAEGA